MSKEQFRICPESGLQFHKPAEQLMRANAVVAVVMLLIGGLTAIAGRPSTGSQPTGSIRC